MKTYTSIPANWKFESRPQANPKNMIQGEKWRICVLTAGLVRLEYQEDGRFEDRPTQMALNRDFPPVDFQVLEDDTQLEIFTSRLHLIYNRKPFSKNGLSIQVKGNLSPYHSIWRFGEKFEDLGGTARTLDLCDGPTSLEHGIIGKNGFSLLDDSRSLVLTEDGWVETRQGEGTDLYFWGYGHDYKEALKDFFFLCGSSPMIPRYALGNWWSRFYPYTQESYLQLMDRFQKEEIPFSVCVIDMDWHVTDIDPKYGSGWTGYTWNKELFPHPEEFLKELHRRGLHTTLNLHPADGIRACEEIYEPMARDMGIDPKSGQPVNFDAASPDFFRSYFKNFTHPQEQMGVDFWWIDWQSGGACRVEGMDPLWMLNHYHYLDNRRDKKRPMIFSRYAGPGSHRYPVGFSGDTLVTWNSLDFQPYFTATASNIGYGFWSHDIGGHMLGEKDDEMAGRWLQFGVFSPIMRLHSSNSPFNGKEPWRYKPEIREMMKKFLRLRQRMIPYLYTMNWRCWKEGLPLILPMYYSHPEQDEAYQVPNEYEFGSELLAAPVTTPRIRGLNVSRTAVWLPEGLYFDVFTGMKYRGGRKINLYRSIDSIPVLAKAGAIIPMDGREFSSQDKEGFGTSYNNPSVLSVHVYPGADGTFTLYEDDSETEAYLENICVRTRMDLSWGKDAVFTIRQPEGHTGLLPGKRAYEIIFHNLSCSGWKLTVNGREAKINVSQENGLTSIRTDYLPPAESRIDLTLFQVQIPENDTKAYVFDFLNQAEIAFELKDRLYEQIVKADQPAMALSQLIAMDLDPDLLGAVAEILTA